MIPKTSLAMVQTGHRQLEPREIAIPEIDDGSAILQIEACGICGSDYEQFEGQLPAPLPVIPGHEPLGRIAAIGDGAAARWGVDVGDRVAVETLLACRSCPTCVSGHYQRCSDLRVYSLITTETPPGLWGAYSQYMFLDPGSIVHKMDPGLPASLAVMFNPLGAGFRWAVEIPGTSVGDSVLIMGPGQRGLASVIACKQAGASQIIVTGLAQDASKLEVARRFGADHVIDVENEDLVSRVRELTGGAGVDVVVDVSPYATKPVTDAMAVARRGGTIVLAGIKGDRPVPDFLSDVVVGKELTIKGATGVTSSGYRAAIRTIESGAVALESMHTHDFRLEDAELAIRTLAREIPGDESIHSCIVPEH
ncbi:MAG: alcohol dehydrogenase catalytic domain-containing protein [Deltaproteobacteria bacterium]|nr:alcohol dehydrogenase catalytic domain-containing protein [Deltaproteobacteria bacterium]